MGGPLIINETLPDEAARTMALTDIDRSFLVEAGAGSGKTSIMAGRVAVLFARGVVPKNVAAITFTEFAASELRIRIDRFVNELCNGTIPPDLECAFPKEVPVEQRANLAQAKNALDQLVCATIHGFAQALIKPYPAEAGIDPGAEIVDPAEADLAFDERYQAWLKDHLSGTGNDDIVAELVIADEARGLALIRSVADFLRRNRDSRPATGAWSSDAVEQFLAAANAFEQEIGRFNFLEDQTHTACQEFIGIAKTLGASAIATNRPDSRTLTEAAGIPRHLACFTQKGEKRQLKTKGAWEKAAAAAGKRKIEGSMAFDACRTRYDVCHDTFETLMAIVAGELLRRIVEVMDGLLMDWSNYKRAAALLDFDDLLYTARDLLTKNEEVRQALAKRFRHVLVDELQDTDPLQIEILWRLCGEAPKDGNSHPLARVPRAGALFLVGDPKQAIYRFRGADVNAYLAAREAIGKEALLEIVANFRSVEPILTFVNHKFEKPLSLEVGQPGFTALAATCKAGKDVFAVVSLDIAIEGDKPSADMLRDAEAERIAELCTRLVGNAHVRERGVKRACRFGDIALLAPVGTDLWRFEEALEQRGIPVSTQAGKGFFRRQEIHDLIAVTRTIADARDTLALGALLRGPLIGLTEAELLDISEGLPADQNRPDRPPQLTLWTELDNVSHELSRRVLEILQSLAKRARSTTPYMLLSDAVSLLDVRAQLRQRFWANADRALANVDLFLEMARAYDVRGLRAFARDMRTNWEEQVRQVEGRPDAEEQSVSLITIHASKGLEWPIVIPINMTGSPKSESGLMHDRKTGEFSIPVLNIEPAGYAVIKSWNEAEHARERVRLWYVAATRARELLVLPRHAAELSDKSWARIVDLDIEALPAINPEELGGETPPPPPIAENTQTSFLFADEAKRISEAAITILWHRPSLHEDAESQSASVPVFSDPESAEADVPGSEITGSATRGTILHKLMEEVLTGETQAAAAEVERRATELLAQLGQAPSADPKIGIAPKELAASIVRTLNLPEIAALRPRLVPEHTVFGSEIDGRTETLTSGIADAVARDAHDNIETIIDWKSDVEMNDDKLSAYRAQLGDYRKQTGAKRALLVLMTVGKILNA
jgi:ATP-dependent exoDNAse (exonuclease V) beta subunit